MRDPVRLVDQEGLSSLERDLLEDARTPRRSAARRRRHAARVAGIAAPIGLGTLVAGEGSALAAWLKAVTVKGGMHAGWGYAATLLASAAVTLGLAMALTPRDSAPDRPVHASPAAEAPVQHAEPQESPLGDGWAAPTGDAATRPHSPSDATTAADQMVVPDEPAPPASRALKPPPEDGPRVAPGEGPEASLDTDDPREANPTGDATPDDSLAAEAAMIAEAQSALGRDATSALATVEQHARRFPNGRLGPERELVRLEALQRLGRHAEARARAEALLRSSTSQLYGERLRGILARLP